MLVSGIFLKFLSLRKVLVIFLVTLLLIILSTLGYRLVSSAKHSLKLGLPIACQLNRDCFILLYPDRDPGP